MERFRIPLPDPCLTCPPLELIENAVLGGLIKAMLPERDRLIAERLAGKVASVNVEHIALAVEKGAATGLNELQAYWRRSLEHSQKVLKQLDEAPLAQRHGKQSLETVLQDLALQEARPDKGCD